MMKREAASGRAESIRRVCYFGLALIVANFVGSPAYALDPMGPPASDLMKGEHKGGIDVSLTSQDLDMTQGNWTLSVGGVPEGSGIADLGVLKDFETYRAYATVGYGLTHSLEAFLRIGGTTAELGDEFWGQGEQFESRTELAVGAGVKATFFEEMALKIGGLVQANYCEFDGQLDSSQWAGPHFAEIEMIEVQAAVGATYLFSDRLSVYGGPFAHVIYGDMDYVYSESDGSTLATWRFAWDIDDSITYGGYFGSRIVLKRNCIFNIEYQQTGNANAIGASVMWKL